ncbi:hypothetical protein HDU97_009512 [Phlyctochytrium planicorne]|nr:hypothetical protein HDU97_009512 [Phlyctochytrium planicorne]
MGLGWKRKEPLITKSKWRPTSTSCSLVLVLVLVLMLMGVERWDGSRFAGVSAAEMQVQQQNQSNSVTILVVAPQFDDDFGTFSDSNCYVGGLSFICAAEAAVSDVVSAKTGVGVNLVFYDNWNPNFKSATNYSWSDSGGYSAAGLYDIVTTMNITAIVGDSYSSTSIFTVGVASQFKIPFCGPSQGSPTLSDFRNFPYFFRVQLGKGIGPHIARFFAYYSIKRVVLISGPDLFSASAMDETETYLARSGVTILARLRVTLDMLDKDDYSPVLQRMKLLGGVYYLTSLLAEHVSGFFYTAADNGFVTKETVWMGFNTPYLDRTLPDDMIAKHKAYATGYIVIGPTQESSEFATERFRKKYWSRMNQTNPAWFEEANGVPYEDSAALFDCMKITLLGINQYLENNPHLKASDLSNPVVRAGLTISKFSDLGYHGVTTSESQFSDEGDLLGPFIFVDFRESLMGSTQVVGYRDAFALTYADASDFVELRSPLLFGNSSKWPSDSSSGIEIFMKATSLQSYILQVIGMLSLLLAFFSLYFLFNRWMRRTVKDGVHVALMLVASGLLALSSFYTIGQMTEKICRLSTYLQHLPCAIIFSLMAQIGFWRRFRLKNQFKEIKQVDSFRIVPVAILIGLITAVVLLIADSKLDKHIRMESEGDDDKLFANECTMSSTALVHLSYAIQLLMLILALVLTDNAESWDISRLSQFMLVGTICLLLVNELRIGAVASRLLKGIIKNFMSIAASSNCIQNLLARPRFRAKSNFDAASAQRPVTALMLGRVVVSEKTMFGWSIPVQAECFFLKKQSFRCKVVVVQDSEVNIHQLEDIREGLNSGLKPAMSFNGLWQLEGGCDNKTLMVSVVRGLIMIQLPSDQTSAQDRAIADFLVEQAHEMDEEEDFLLFNANEIKSQTSSFQ